MNKRKKEAKLRSIDFNGDCNRCGSNRNITLHHIFPKKNGHQRLQTNLLRNKRYEALCQKCHNKENKTAQEMTGWNALFATERLSKLNSKAGAGLDGMIFINARNARWT